MCRWCSTASIDDVPLSVLETTIGNGPVVLGFFDLCRLFRFSIDEVIQGRRFRWPAGGGGNSKQQIPRRR